MDRLTAMRVFVEVAGGGSFSAAAERLDMSRAMVTRYVGALEQWLGARLLQRTTRSVTLTDAGEHCLRRSQQMLALMEDVQDETSSHDDRLRGQLRITCRMSLAYAEVAAAVVDFLQLHPQLKINLNASEGALNLVEARIDLAIRISAEPDPALIGRVLAPCTSVLVASPAYLARHGVPQSPAELATHRCLSYANFGKSVWKLRARRRAGAGQRQQRIQRQRSHLFAARRVGRWRPGLAAALPGASAPGRRQPATRAAGLGAAGHGDLRALHLAPAPLAGRASPARFPGRALRQHALVGRCSAAFECP